MMETSVDNRNNEATALCEHTQSRLELMPPGSGRYGRVVCLGCGKQLCWEPFPGNISRKQQNAIYIRQILGSNRLNDWERGFCEGIQHHPRISPRQQSLLDGLFQKHLLRGESKHGEQPNRNGVACYSHAA